MLVMLSGGRDSAVLLAERPNNTEALFVNYGQRNLEKEQQAAQAIAGHYNVPLHFMTLEGLYPAGAKDKPFRNGILISMGISLAAQLGQRLVAYAGHKGAAEWAAMDNNPYFHEAMHVAAMHGTGGQVKLFAPYLAVSKQTIYRRGEALKVPWQLTWSCYGPGPQPCGECKPCKEVAALC